jgi:hypothetical protein
LVRQDLALLSIRIWDLDMGIATAQGLVHYRAVHDHSAVLIWAL